MVDDYAVVPLEDIQVDDRLNYIERSVTILDWKTKTLRNKVAGLGKVQWHHRKGSEWIWEPEEEIGSITQGYLRQWTSRTKSDSSRG